MIDHHDESLLAISMYLLSRGEPKEKVTEMLMHFGWDEITARRAIKDVLTFLPSQKFQPRPSLVSVTAAWLAVSGLILLFGDHLFVLPDQWPWRIASALALSIAIPTVFVIFWTLFAMAWDRIDR